MIVFQEVTLHRRKHTPHSPGFLCRRIGPMLLATVLFLLTATPQAQAGELVESLKNHPATIRGENLHVPLLFRAIARQAGITIYVADNIEDTITLEVEERSLYDIFNLVISAKKLRYYEKDGFLLVQKEEDFKNIAENLVTERICTKYGKAEEYKEQLLPLLSKSGTLNPTDRGNCLVITDHKDSLAKISVLLGELDRPVPQVYIEARIVVLSDTAKRRLGIKWGFTEQIPDDLGNVTVSSNITQTVGHTANLVVGYVRKNLNINMELQALEEDQLARILSSPRILVLDGREAEIKQGKEIAYVTQTSDTINTSFREANLSLKVIPRVLKNRYIVLDVAVTNDSVSATTTGGQPTIDTQEISSTLFLEDAQTVVIGGILQENEDKTKQRVPFLSKIPVLGNLFKSKDNKDTRSELQVFITPTILTMDRDLNSPPAPAAGEDEKMTLPEGAAPTAQITTSELSGKELQGPTAAPETGETTTPATEPQYLFAVQVASFRQEENAQKMAESLRANGYTPHVKKLTSEKGGTWYTVRLGEYPDRSSALSMAGKYKDKERKDAMIVSLQ